MSLIYCPNCDELLPATAKRCTTCGKIIVVSGHQLSQDLSSTTTDGGFSSESPPSDSDIPTFRLPYISSLGSSQNGLASNDEETVPMSRPHISQISIATSPLVQGPWELEGNQLSQASQQATWHKEVEYRSQHRSIIDTPRPPQPKPRFIAPSYTRRRRLTPVYFFWASLTLFLILVLGGVFGVVATLSHGLTTNKTGMALQVTPKSIASGGTIALHGTNFSPHEHIGLSRDASIPILDTGGNSVIETDVLGDFYDTAVIDSDWGAGPHILDAEDAITHKIASFPIMVTGQSVSLRPAHLHLSVNTLNLGLGDETTNTTMPITLSNLGGGQISWQSIPDQPWLQISPSNGSFTSEQAAQVTIAIDRANLQPGAYNGQILFHSSVGDIPLPVTMQVIPLIASHAPVLQLTPAVLSFSAVDGGASPPAQTITVSNPGVLPLHWTAATNQQWLSVSTQSDTTGGSSSESVLVNINTSTLLPGTYNGVITFTGAGPYPVRHSPQRIAVSVTVTPRCTLQVSPNILEFTGVYLQSAPPAKAINLASSSSCTSAIPWNATSNASWLTISATKGTTPANPAVSVNTTNLTPGVYNSSINFSTATGTQSLTVSLAIGQPATPIMAIASTAMAFTSVVGQGSSPPPQTTTLTNTGGGTLTWKATAATTVGGAWLAVSPSSGTLTANQSVKLSATATVLGTLTPSTYTGSITVTGTGGTATPVTGNPQTIPVSLTINAACTATATPTALTFIGGSAQPVPAAQAITITAAGACANPLNWTATVTTTPANGTWLNATQISGTVTLTAPSAISLGVVTTGLAPGTYTGTIAITTTDSVSHAQVGTPQNVPITLIIQPPCTLQAASTPAVNFTSEVGVNPSAKTFTISAIGSCAGSVTITPSITLISGTGWLAIAPASATITTGGSQTFTVTVTSSSLATGGYSGAISLVATNSGQAVVNSPQTVSVGLTVASPPALTVSPTSLAINATTGTLPQPITISNSGGTPLNWKASLDASAPSFVSLSANSGKNLVGGTSTLVNVIINAAGMTGGNYTTNMIVSAIDSLTGQVTKGGRVTIPIAINVAAAMQVSDTTLLYTTTTGSSPPSQGIVISNAGSDTLLWRAKLPSQPWLSIAPNGDSDRSGAKSVVTLSANAHGMVAGSYLATVVIVPSVGAAVKVKVTLTITGPAPPNSIVSTKPIVTLVTATTKP